jgi:hypothetical protein
VTIQPGDNTAAGAGDRGHLRASHADREQVIGVLKAAFVAGMLAEDEFDARVSQAFASRTYAELAVVTADLPAMPAAAQPARPARARGEQPVLRARTVMMGTTALYAGVWAFTVLPPWPVDSEGEGPQPVLFLLLISTIVYLIVMAVGVTNVLASWQEKRSGGQLPRRPASGAGGPASPRRRSAAPDRQLPPTRDDPPYTAEAAQSCSSRPPTPPRRAHPLSRQYATS